LVYGDFAVLDDSKDRFVYSRTLEGTTYIVDCNLGKKSRKAYKPGKDYTPVFLSCDSTDDYLKAYEARIWSKKA
jgi:hypothetical protein